MHVYIIAQVQMRIHDSLSLTLNNICNQWRLCLLLSRSLNLFVAYLFGDARVVRRCNAGPRACHPGACTARSDIHRRSTLPPEKSSPAPWVTNCSATKPHRETPTAASTRLHRETPTAASTRLHRETPTAATIRLHRGTPPSTPHHRASWLTYLKPF